MRRGNAYHFSQFILRYLEGKKKRYTTYGLGAGMYSLNYYSFVRLCKEAGANIQIKKKVVVDLDILDAYLEAAIDMEGGAEECE